MAIICVILFLRFSRSQKRVSKDVRLIERIEPPELEAKAKIHYEMPNRSDWASEPGVVHDVPGSQMERFELDGRGWRKSGVRWFRVGRWGLYVTAGW